MIVRLKDASFYINWIRSCQYSSDKEVSQCLLRLQSDCLKEEISYNILNSACHGMIKLTKIHPELFFLVLSTNYKNKNR